MVRGHQSGSLPVIVLIRRKQARKLIFYLYVQLSAVKFLASNLKNSERDVIFTIYKLVHLVIVVVVVVVAVGCSSSSSGCGVQ